MQPKVTFYSNELSRFLSGKECKKSSCHTEIATEDTFCIKHHFNFFSNQYTPITWQGMNLTKRFGPGSPLKKYFFGNWAKRKKKDFFTVWFVQPNFSKQSSKLRFFHTPQDIPWVWKNHGLVLGCIRKPAETTLSDHILWENMGSEF